MQAMANGSSSAVIQNSLRFRSSATTYLSRTPSTASNRTTWTWSGWVKRGTLTTATNTGFFAGYFDLNNRTELKFTTTDLIEFLIYNAGTVVGQLVTTQVFRDPSAWYHIVAVMNTGNATAADRMRLYINGSQVTAFSSTTTPAQNTLTQVNNILSTQALGRNESATELFDGYLAEVNFVDGQALSASSFGSTNSTTGVWQPIPYSGAYGTNGYYLPFSNIALTSGSNTGLGQDFSGNGNYYNTTNISVTAGVTYDAMTDSPKLTSATIANYCTLNPISSFFNSANFQTGVPSPAASITNGNLTYSRVGAAAPNSVQIIAGTIGVSTGKWYWEWVASSQYNEINAGIIDDNLNLYSFDNGRAVTVTYNTAFVFGSTIFTGANGNIYGMAFDAGAGTLSIYENNVLKITTSSIPTGRTWRPTFGDTASTGTTTANINFGQRPFTYTPPTGYVAINTFNLSDSTIVNGASYMDATTYTGNGTSLAVTNSASIKPDFVWIKSRAGGFDHYLFDSVRGIYNYISSNKTTAEIANSNTLQSFNSNGFTLGSGVGTLDGINKSGDSEVAWQWQAGMGSTSTNTNGSITSTVSVNQAVGFSIVTYTGTGLSATVGHGLGTTPKILIIKNRSAVTDWPVFTSAFDGSWDFFYLNLTNAKADAANTPPTSLVFTESGNANQGASGNNYVAYCWAEIAGFSRFGSYIGNGNANGPFIYLGFRPKYIMIKRSDSTGNWSITDSVRNTTNIVNFGLVAEAATAETTGTSTTPIPYLDFLSNGFKIRQPKPEVNASTGAYIYMAFAENPFKNALAR